MNGAALRILIVDDCPDSARMLRMLLKREGYDVRIEFDGEAALAAAAEFSPHVALLDLGLPGMSGLEAAAELRKRSSSAGDRPALVAVSGHGEEALPSPSPFDRHFQKPLNHEALKAYLKEVGAESPRPFRDAPIA